MATLFGRDVKTIGKHVNNALHEELANVPTVANFAIVQNEGGRIVNRTIEFYSIDMIMSVGYRVKSEQGIKFRRWANQVLKDYLLKGYVVNQRISVLEHQVANLTEKVDFFVRSSPSGRHLLRRTDIRCLRTDRQPHQTGEAFHHPYR